MYRIIHLLLVSVIVSFSVSFPVAGQDFSAWSSSQTILLNTTAEGADIDDTLFNFPVLLRLTPDNFSHFQHTRDSGDDIRFSKMDGTPLPYQIEDWRDGTDDADTATIWILVDTLPANKLTPAFIMYWGNSEASDSSDGAAVFTSANGFSGVWHLDESSATPTLSDATGNGYAGNRNGNVSQSPGVISYGQEFDGTDDYADMGNVLNPESSNFTVSAWLKRDSLDAWQAIFCKTNGGDPAVTYGWIFNINGNNQPTMYIASENGSNWGDPGSYRFSQADSIVDTTTWHHVAAVIDRSSNSACKIYIDGVNDSCIETGDITGVGTVSNAVNARIGSEADGEYQFNGYLDEITFSTTARSDAWIRLCYENQKPDQSLVQTSGSFVWMNDGGGDWGDDANWSPDGTVLTTWPGRGFNAQFDTVPADEQIVLTVTDTQYVDSMIFGTSGYRIEGDVLFLNGVNGGIFTAASVDSAIIDAEITGTNGLSKYGTGTLILSGDNTYSGNTSVDAGTLAINGSLSDTSDVMVSSDGTLTGSGTINGDVTVSGGTIAPGYNGAGTLTLGSLVLDDAATLTFDLNDTSDTLVITGDVTLDGTLSFTLDNDIEAGDYLIITTAGTITNDTFEITQPSNGFTCTLIYTDSTVIARLRDGLFLSTPSDTIVQLGTTVHFAVSAEGDGTLSYLWQREPDEEVGTVDTLSFDPAALADSGNYRCIVTDENSTDTSSWFHVAVLDSPRIETQPAVTEINSGGSGSLWLTVSNTDQLTFAWYKVGDATELSTGAALTFDDISLDDAGSYYCLLSNPIAGISSDTVLLTIIPASIQAYFKFSPGAGVAPLAITFTDSSIGTIETRHWNFGDAGTDTAVSPQHIYTDAGTYSVALAVSGPEGEDTLLRENAIRVFSKDNNPLSISAIPFGTDSAVITISGLDNAPVSLCDSVGIWLAADTIPSSLEEAIRIARYPVTDFTQATFTDTLPLTTDDSTVGLLTGLFWNTDTIAPVDPAHGTVLRRTASEHDTGFGSIIELTALSWDSTDGQIRVSWCIDTSIYKGDMDIGIAYSRVFYPDSSAINWKTVFFTPCTDTIVYLNEPVQFESLYYIRLFIRKTGDKWASSPQLSNDTIRTGKPYRQITRFFDENTGDTVGIFNNRVRLWKDPSVSGRTLTTDTVQLDSFDAPEGFAVTGSPISFIAANSRPSFYIGFSIDSLPEGYSIRDVRIYHENNSEITVEHDTKIDSSLNMVFLRASPTKETFIPMIDMSPPVAAVYPVADSIADPNEDITDTVHIHDNISNVKWTYLYGKGDEIPVARDSGMLSDTGSIQPLSISQTSHAISSESGVRILLVISDGPHSDTIDMSRSVFREESDPLFTLEDMWHPVYPTADLYSSDPETLLIDKIDSSNIRYDQRFVRLFRWIETDSTKNMDAKWLEFDPENAVTRELFSLNPGRLFWIKTRKSALLHLGDAHTLSLKDTFRLTLPAKQFTDFGLPYRFPVRLQSIFNAGAPDADSMHYHVWVRDSATGIFKTALLYLTTMPDRKDASVALTSENSAAYTIYNPLAHDVTLCIPPLPAVMASPVVATSAAKKKTETGWSVKLHTTENNGFSSPPLYCGYAPDAPTTPFPITPSFNGSAVYVYDRALAKKQGHYFTATANEGILQEVHFANPASTPKTMSYSFTFTGAFPETFSAKLFDKNSGTFTTEGSVTVPAQSVASRWISVGDAAWHNKLSNTLLKQQYRLHRLYPNPARSQITIRYSVPFGADEKLAFSIFDMKGRRIWNKRITAMLTSGIHHTTWNGRDNKNRLVGSGMYIVRFAVTDRKGATLHRFDQCITFFP